MSGSIGLSLQQQFDLNGNLLIGGKLYFFQAGTSTPQSAYQDSALTIVHPNPITLGSDARVPQLFIADGSIRVRLTDSGGVAQFDTDNILVVGPSSGSGGGGSVDATTILATGDLKQRYGTGTLSGFVRCNARTIGSASSGATERANADTQSLFEYLWTNDSTLTVSGGRGASANADWVANKTIALPDFRGRVLAGLDDMGNSAASRLTSTYFGSAATTLGTSNGAENRTVLQANLPNVALSGTATPTSSPVAIDPAGYNAFGGLTAFTNNTGSTEVPAWSSRSGLVSTLQVTLPNYTVSVGLNGSGTALAIVQPTSLITIYIKL